MRRRVTCAMSTRPVLDFSASWVFSGSSPGNSASPGRSIAKKSIRTSRTVPILFKIPGMRLAFS